ncbi:MAG: SUMF1/EgtB/PvdO family nonheme iron enzyme [Pseudomonadota bacterium]
MADVFLSYKREDEQKAHKILQALEGQGISVWWDQRLTPKSHWDKLIETEISKAKAVLVLWSSHSSDSDWVRAEANYAIENDKLVQARFDDRRPPLLFAMRQYADLQDWSGDSSEPVFVKLLYWISLLLGRDAPTSDPRIDVIRSRYEQSKPSLSPDFVSGDENDRFASAADIKPDAMAGTTFRDAPWSPLLSVIPAGEFNMGNVSGPGRESELPVHKVAFERPFAIGVYPTTFLEWDIGLNSGKLSYSPKDMGWGRGDRPVIHVSFEDVVGFIEWLSFETGNRYRLPSEAEWEYACRAGTTTPFFSGDQLKRNASSTDSATSHAARSTQPVGQIGPNAYGLYDMHGNVWEWVADTWVPNYEGAPSDGSPRASDSLNADKVIRGGSWGFSDNWLRSSARDAAPVGSRLHNLGFRVVREL